MMEDRKRLWFLLAVFIAAFLLVIFRLAYLQLFNHDFYLKRSLEQRKHIINLATRRGDILDRNGNILATSIDTYSIYMYKKGWIARKVPLAEAQKLQQQQPAPTALLKDKKRVYPHKSLGAQLIGFVGVDNQGLSGIELAFDEFLKGKEGQLVTEGDPQGRELYKALRELEPGMDGMTLTLTIDENIQYIAEKEISGQVQRSGAIAGMCLVMDARTGEILALASKPDFDPNLYQSASYKLWHPRFLDPYEPGSTFKLISTAAGLEEKVITPDTRLEAKDSITVGGKVIENSHSIKWPGTDISVSYMLEQSINTGAVQIGLKLGPERFYRRIKAFGFGESTGIGLKGESRGIVRHWKHWYKPDIAMMTFGQSIAVTPLQLLSAVSAFADNGTLLQPFIVKKIESNDGKFVKYFTRTERGSAVSGKVAAQMKELMNNVVRNGSGRRAKMAWFFVAGKTGTAQKANPGGRGYQKGHFIASFIGFAPLKDPRIVCLVIVDDPKGVIWGETVCGPVFKDVVEYSLRYLNVKPDMI